MAARAVRRDRGPTAGVAQRRGDLVADLVPERRDARAHRRMAPARHRAAVAHRRDRVDDGARRGAAPPGVDDTEHAGDRVEEHDRHAVRDEDADRDGRVGREEHVRLEPRVAGAVTCHPHDVGAVHLAGDHEALAGNPHRRGEAPPVLRDAGRVVADVVTEVERVVGGGAHAAVARRDDDVGAVSSREADLSRSTSSPPRALDHHHARRVEPRVAGTARRAGRSRPVASGSWRTPQPSRARPWCTPTPSTGRRCG